MCARKQKNTCPYSHSHAPTSNTALRADRDPNTQWSVEWCICFGHHRVACAKVTSHWCPVGCLAWKAARELCVSCGWYQLAGIVCRRWQGPGGALVVLYFACLDPAHVWKRTIKKKARALVRLRGRGRHYPGKAIRVISALSDIRNGSLPEVPDLAQTFWKVKQRKWRLRVLLVCRPCQREILHHIWPFICVCMQMQHYLVADGKTLFGGQDFGTLFISSRHYY